MSSTLPVRPHPPLLSAIQRPPIKFTFVIPFQLRRKPKPSSYLKTPISASSDPSPSSSSWEREELRWLREEERWLREEQRWIREESRWNSERESLLREITGLRLRIEALESERPSVADAFGRLEAALRTAKEGQIAAAGGQPVLVEEAEVKEMVLEEGRVSEGNTEMKYEKEMKKEERKTLRMGSEGEDVRAMQEALLRLGFYSGEEDMEFSSFSTGTERAVKTWQASLGNPEDGIMTSELLQILFMEQRMKDSVSAIGDGGANGAAVASATRISETQQSVIKESGDEEVEASHHKVFLLGENRWEEPSRLAGRNRPISRGNVVSSTKCITCHGEGRLMCTECDGSGEPNIEPQFLEWVGEGAKCPYCEGLGFTICDVCEGKTVVHT